MRIVLFCHSLISDWNHGNAHFLRGCVEELLALGNDVAVYESRDAWSLTQLIADHGLQPVEAFSAEYPMLRPTRYALDELDLQAALHGADLVLVHEWNEPELVRRIGEHHAQHPDYTLFFHDTHHRCVSAPHELGDITHYDAVLAFGDVVRRTYLERAPAQRAFTWHEAADVRRFRPRERSSISGDLVWIGNFVDDERTAELREFLIEPVRELKLKARVYGVRYPEPVVRELSAAGIDYAGYLPNWRVPEVFARYRVTIHVPRGPYTRALPGIPTIRPFEAMACGIPLISAAWDDCERLFNAGSDYLLVQSGREMRRALSYVLEQPARALAMAQRALCTIMDRHTCAHRVRQLLRFHEQVQAARRPPEWLRQPAAEQRRNGPRRPAHPLAGG